MTYETRGKDSSQLMTKREEFAKAAMQGLLASPIETDLKTIAEMSAWQADALIRELNKETPNA